MQVQVSTDRNINGDQAATGHITGLVDAALSRVSDRLTRVEIYLSDENSDQRGGADIRCLIEGRLERRRPVAVTHQAVTVDQAVSGAASKLARLLESTIGRARNHQSHARGAPRPGVGPARAVRSLDGTPPPEE